MHFSVDLGDVNGGYATAVLCDSSWNQIDGTETLVYNGEESLYGNWDDIIFTDVSSECTIKPVTVKYTYRFKDDDTTRNLSPPDTMSPVYLYWGNYASNGTGTVSGMGILSASFPLNGVIQWTAANISVQKAVLVDGDYTWDITDTLSAFTVSGGNAQLVFNLETNADNVLHVTFSYSDPEKSISGWESTVTASLTESDIDSIFDGEFFYGTGYFGGSMYLNENFTPDQISSISYTISPPVDFDPNAYMISGTDSGGNWFGFECKSSDQIPELDEDTFYEVIVTVVIGGNTYVEKFPIE